jgi:RNA ligase (TIGR02306 family)
LFPDACERWKGIPFDVTEKLDGQSASYFVIPNPKKGLFRPKWIFGVCSRNFQLIKEDNSSYWTIAKQENLKEKMTNWCKEWNTGLIIQGEIIGSKIQGNKYNLDGVAFHVFNVVEYDDGERVIFNQRQQSILCGELSLHVVPVLCPDYILPPTIHEIIEYSKGKSTIDNILREGIVVRNYDFNISFKAVNPDFLLKYGE